MNKTEIVKAFITALQSGDQALAAHYMADNFTFSGWTQQPIDREEFLAIQSELEDAMPDFSYNLSDVHEEGDKVESLIQISGTHSHDLALPMLGVPLIQATGLAVSLPQVHALYTFDDSRIVQMSVEEVPGGGLAGLLQQLGRELPVLPRLREFAQMAESPLYQEIEEHDQPAPWGSNITFPDEPVGQ